MKKIAYRQLLAWPAIACAMVILSTSSAFAQINFTPSGLQGENLNNPTSLMFGPDDRLYVSQQNGFIYAYTIVRNGPNDYAVTATEQIDLVKNIPNHNADGVLNPSVTNRQITGLYATGTASNPVLYVSSSDPRIGGGGSSTNTNLDENSGVISRLTWNGSQWVKVDLVRGLPRSEENHSTNGMQIDPQSNVMYVASGGHTNKGAPSNNFTFLPEFAYSAAILTVDLTAIDQLPTLVDGNGQSYKYDLPTLDDEDKTNVGSPTPGYEDVNDPWGGNGGKNQAELVIGGPVQVYASGFRNHYDVLLTTTGRLYTFDNGPNSGWGGTPINNCSNDVNESNSGTECDNLHYVSAQGYYGGHPNPTRANRNNTFNTTNPQSPVPLGLEDPFCDYRIPLSQDGALAIVCASTNGMAEYTASNFNGAMQGDLLAAAFNGTIQRFVMNAAGDSVLQQSAIFSGFGSSPLDLVALGDVDPFPGTVWACTYGSDNITIFEPADFVFCTGTDTSFSVDSDGDGYSNGDELAAGTDQCNAASRPEDFDGDFVSDITDNDDDNDGILDTVDLFARDASDGAMTYMPVSYQFDNSVDPGINGWGFTGLMADGSSDYMDLYDVNRMTVGGAALKFTIDSVETGDALGALNDQEYGFQFGVNVGQVFGPFTVEAEVEDPFSSVPPANDMSQGMYIGAGDQDNYLKAVVHANGGAGGIEVVTEIGGAPVAAMYSVPAVLTANSVQLYLKIDPNTNQVQPQYAINGGAVSNLGSPLVVPATWLQNVLAVGFIATSRNAPQGFPATWDYVTVTQDSVTAIGQWYDVPYNSPAPTARHENSFVQVGDHFHLIGGRGNKATQAFNINDSTWTTGTAPPFEIHHFQAVNYEGMIWCVGAMTGGFPNETPVPNIMIYDPLTDTWHTGPAIPAGRQRGSSGVIVYNDEIYVLSGIQNGHLSGWVTWVDKFNPRTNTWTVLADAPRARDHWQALLVGDKIYAMGGRRSGAQGTFGATVAEVDVYDIATNTWSTLPTPVSDIPTQRAAGVVGLLGDEAIIAGGESGTQSAAHEETEAVHITTDQWRSLAPMLDSRHGTSAIVNNGGIWVAAGSGNRGGSPELNTMEAFFFFGPRQPLGSPVAPSSFAATPNPHNYGQVLQGSTVSQGFSLTNMGGDQGILVTSLNFTGDPDFAHNFPYTLPVVIPPGGFLNFDIDFTPGALGARSGVLEVGYAGSTTPLSIVLNGEGINLTPLYRVNSAGPNYTTGGGDLFVADQFFSGGSTSSTGNAIANTTDDDLYQTERWGNPFSYQFPVGGGLYEVRLHFAEIWAGGQNVGARVFNVALEGSNVLSNYDIFADVGGYTAVVKTFQVNVTDGTLDVDFTAVVNNAKVSAIEVYNAGSGPGSNLVATPDPMHFFSQQINTTSLPQTLKLENAGGDTITVTAICVSGADAADFGYSFTPPAVIPPGDSTLVNFTFSPTTIGLKSAQIDVIHTGVNTPMAIALTGEAVNSIFGANGVIVQNPVCPGDSNGIATVQVQNGLPPFSYLWTPSGATTDTAYGLWAGLHTVRVIDANNDTVFAQVTLTENPVLTTMTACRDQNNNLGVASVSASGGASPYTYLWDVNAGSSTNDTVFGLVDGTYAVSVTDANGCQVVDSITINASTITCDTCALPPGWAHQDIGAVQAAGDVCYDSQTGTFTVDASGNDIWNAADEFHFVYQTLTGDGEIIARVTGITGTNNWAKAGVMMRNTLNANSIHAFMTKTFAQGVSFQRRPTTGGNSQHTTSANGSLPVWVRLERVGNTFTGYWGTDGINWTQQGSQTITMGTTVFIGLAVTSHDDGVINTSTFDNVQIIGTSTLTAAATVISDYNGQHISCNGGNDGIATVTANGGTAPYSYLWDSNAGSSTNDTVFGLAAGTYAVTVTDANANTAVANVTVTEPPAVATSTTEINPASSATTADGSATVAASGGVPGYTYLWDSNAGSSTNDSVFGLLPGQYYVTVTDLNGCTAVDSVEITVDSIAFALRINAGGPQYISVLGDTFVADVHFLNGSTFSTGSAIGGTSDPTLYQTERYESPLNYAIPVPAADNYTVILHFAEIFAPNNQAGDRVFDVNLEGQLVLDDYDIFASAGQFTADVHSIQVFVGDGTLNLDLLASVDNGKLSAIEVLRINGAPLELIAATTDLSCNGGSDGAIDLTVTGGTQPYTFAWNDGPTTEDRTNLSAGTYIVTVTDAAQDSIVDTLVINEPSAIALSGVVVQPIACAGDSNGVLAILASGGTPPYNFQWDANAGSSTNDTVFGLATGSYAVTVTDDKGCTASTTLSLSEPAPLTVGISTTTYNCGFNVSCNGANDGSATASGSGGTAPYSYNWGGGSLERVNAGGPAYVAGFGTFSADQFFSGGQVFSNFSIPNIQNTTDDTLYFTERYGNMSYDVPVNNGQYKVNLHFAEIFFGAQGGGAGGVGSRVFNVDVEGQAFLSNYDIFADVGTESATVKSTVANVTDGVLNIAFTSVVNNAKVSAIEIISLGDTTATISNLPAGTYTVIVTDANGCTVTDSVTLTEPAPVVATATSTDESCAGAADGTATAAATGGCSPYSYQWDANAGSQTTATATGLTAGTYGVTITDANGCQDSTLATVNGPAALNLSAIVDSDVSCNSGNDGQATASATGGTVPYGFLWSNGQTTATAVNLTAGSYTVTVTDANNCTATASVTVSEPAAIGLSLSGTDPACAGDSSGQAAAVATGGTAPYSYLWSDGQTTATATGLPAGTYGITVTDANGCAASGQVNLTAPAPLQTTLTPSVYNCGFNVSCNGAADGSIIANVSGGTAPYTYTWSNASATRINSGNGGAYTAINGDPFLADQLFTQNSGNQSSTGQPIANTQDDALYQTERWGNFSYNIPVSNGNYQVRIHLAEIWTGGQSVGARVFSIDLEGQTVLNNYDIFADVGGYTAVIHSFNATVTDGSLDLDFIPVVNNAKISALEVISLNQPPQNNNNLSAGQYCVTITDANGCQDSACITLTEPAALTASTSISNSIDCAGDGDGAVSVAVSGGCAPYTYQWDANTGSQTTATATGLSGGTYDVTVTDANGCTTTGSVTLAEPAPLSATAVETSAITVNGGSDGEATVTASGGTPPYSYLWSNGQTTATATGLSAGTYTVTVTDANGCTAIDSVTLLDPNAPLDVSISLVTSISCNGGNDGELTANATGGTQPYSYLWSDGQTTATATGLSAGTYSVTVTDAGSNTAADTFSIGEPTAISVVRTVSTFNCGYNVSCNGTCDGTIALSTSGGTGPYTYAWNSAAGIRLNCGGPAFTSSAGHLFAADQFFLTPSNTYSNNTVSDIAGTTDDVLYRTERWHPNLGYEIPVANGTHIVVLHFAEIFHGVPGGNVNNGAGDRIIDVQLEGATAVDDLDLFATAGPATAYVRGFTVNVTDGILDIDFSASVDNPKVSAIEVLPIATSTPNLNGLCAGTYSYLLFDANGCTYTDTLTLTEPAVLATNISATAVSCNGFSDGSASVSASGGCAPYGYLWSNGLTTAAISNLSAGTYRVTVTDANGCTAVDSAVLTAPAALLVNATVDNDVSCNGFADGQATAAVSGGVAPYTYAWSNGQTTATATGLAGGSYTVTVTDANGCIANAAVTIAEPAALTASAQVDNNVSCNGFSDGQATASGTGGTAPYSFLWSNGQNTATAVNLGAGTYGVTITDANGCTATASVVLTEPTALTALAVVDSNVSCGGAMDGGASVTANGGTQPYSYLWSNGQTSASATGLSGGTHSVTVTDANGCTVVSSVVITEPPGFGLTMVLDSNVSCGGATDGGATAVANGGTAPYSYLWSNGQTSASATNLPTGTHSVTVTDVNGCGAIDSIVITEPPVLTVSLGVVASITCHNFNDGEVVATPSGGQPPYSYQWSANANSQTTDTAFGLGAGFYSVTVTDAAGCDVVGTIQVTQPGVLVAAIQVDNNVRCNGGSDGKATAIVFGGTPPYSYLWSTGQTGVSAAGLSAGSYTLTVTDANTCTIVASVGITEPAPVATTIVIDSLPLCSGDQTGGATATATGGTPSYFYQWDQNAGSVVGRTVTGLGAGTYQVFVRDAFFCTDTATVVITEPATLLANATTDNDVSCNGFADGQVRASPAGGTAPYSFAWSTGATSSTVAGLSGGTYYVTVTDSNGCSAVDSATVSEPAALLLSATVDNDVSCNGFSDGQATATANGGTAPYSYLWSNGATTATATGLSAGAYTVTVTDGNGCSAIAAINIAAPAAIALSVSLDNDVSCNGFSDGQATATASGGTAPLSYLWSNGATTPVAANLAGGTHSVTVTDANGCTVSDSVVVNEPPLLTATAVVDSNIVCSSNNDGQATVTAGGGVPPYSYLWSNGQTAATAANLAAGPHSVTVTDANACTAVASVNITATGNIALGLSVQDVSCSGAGDGQVAASPSGGTAPYSYSWSNGQTTATISGLSAGTYSVTVTDANGCTASDSAVVNEPQTPISLTANDVSCNAAMDGSIVASGGTAPYTYSFSLPAQSHTQPIGFGIDDAEEDVNGVVRRGNSDLEIVFDGPVRGLQTIGLRYRNVNIPQGASILSASLQFTTEQANNQNPSALTIVGEAADDAPIYLNQNFNITNRPATTSNVAWSPPNWNAVGQAGPDQQTPDLSTIVQEIVNRGGWNSGNAMAFMVSGVGRRSAWSFNGSQADAAVLTITYTVGQPPVSNTNLGPGTYIVTVTDSNGCTTTDTLTISEPTAIAAQIASSDPTCNGAGDGAASVTATGGTAPYSYLWSNGQTTASLTGLGGGTYVVTVTDANGCTAIDSAVLNEPAAIVISGNDVSCFGDADGSITATGGTAPFSYSISSLGNLVSNHAVGFGRDDAEEDQNGLVRRGGNDLELVFDGPNLGNQAVGMIWRGINIPQGATITNAWIQFTAKNTGNVNPSNLTIEGEANDQPALIVATTFNISNRPRTTANVAWSPVNWTVPFQAGADERTPNIASIVQEIVNRPGWTSGNRMHMIVTGQGRRRAMSFNGNSAQAPELHIEWTMSSSSQTSNLPPGDYVVTVTDANGCTQTDTITIAEPTELFANATVDSNATCNGGNDGSATAAPSGGTAPYSFLWSDGQTTAIASNLSAGTYTVTVTDANGCTATQDVTIVLTSPAFTYTVNDVSCNGGNDGCIEVSGGIPPYSYVLNGVPLTSQSGFFFGRPGQSSDDVEETVSSGAVNLNSISLEMPEDNFAGSNDLQLIGMRFPNVTIPQGATITAASIRFNSSNNASDATDIVLTGEAVDDAPTFSSTNSDVSSRTLTNASVTWNNVPAWTANQFYTSADIGSVIQEIVGRGGWSNGNALVVIASGANGYRDAKSFDASAFQAPTLTVTYTVSPSLCNLTAGTYVLEVTDSTGCTATTTHVIDEPPAIVLTGNDATCPGDSNGSIAISGGTPPYQVSLNGTGPGNVDVRVSASNDDAEESLNGGAINLNSPSLEMADDNFAGSNDPQLVGVRFANVNIPNGAAIINAYIEFTGNANTSDPTNLSITGEAADNAVSYSSANGNVSARAVTTANTAWNNVPAFVNGGVYQTPSLIGIVQEIVNRAGWSNGNAMAFMLSGTGHRDAQSFDASAANAPRLVIEFSSSFSSNTVSGLPGGTYAVTVTDSNGCVASDSIVIDYNGTNCNPCVNQRVQNGILALYPFAESMGNTVYDVGGFGLPLNLTIQDTANVTWLGGNGLAINSGTIIESNTAPTKILNACQASNAITVEAWVNPANTTQGGPTRIVTFSQDPNVRNWTLGSEGSQYRGRIRTSNSALNGTPDLATGNGAVSTSLQHVVMTHDASGNWVIYVDGVAAANGTRTGDYSNWNAGYGFALVNELTQNRAWLGELHLVAVYDRALSPAEIQQNLVAGPNCGGNLPPVAICSAEAQTCNDPLTVDFDGSQSVDGDGSVVAWNWTFGDGNSGSGATVSHTYAGPGTYTYTMIVTDNDGFSDTCTASIVVDTVISGRVRSNLIAEYLFYEGQGEVVHDVSGFGLPLDLTIADTNNVTWQSGNMLSINSGTIIQSNGPATKVYTACSASNEISVEAWVAPANTSQGGPSRIASMSVDPFNRNWSLMQEGSQYRSRIRSTASGVNGTPDLATGNGQVQTSLQHVLFTRDAAGNWLIYRDGIVVATGTRGGNLSNWDASYPLMLVNELTQNRDWLGDLYLVALYDRALTPAEINQNYSAGPDCFGNFAPVALADAEVDLCDTPLLVDVDASASYDVDGTIVFYNWDFGDGGTATGVTASHTYAAAGTYTITLTVTDNDGATDTYTETIVLTGQPGRVDNGLIALYPFFEGVGDTVHDVSGFMAPMDLVVANPANVSWTSTGLSVNASTIIQSGSAATKVQTAVQSTNEISVEAWITPANTSQGGPSRIATMSVDPFNRDFTLAQEGSRYISRLRTTASDLNGMPNLETPNGILATNQQHVVFTRNAVGDWRIWVDGQLEATGTRGGNFSNWNGSYEFALVNELTMNRTWLGELHLVALYNVALDSSAIQQNYQVGPACLDSFPPFAQFNAGTDACTGSLAVDFDGSGSSDPDGTIVSYAWNFGDGNNGSGQMPMHTYATAGTYTVTLTVMDNDGNSTSTAQTVDVSGAGRVKNGLIAWYVFDEGAGNTVADISGFGAPLDLTIADTNSISWLPGNGISVNSATTIASAVSGSKITVACQATNQLTVEAWVRPANTSQGGPARIVTLSPDPSNRNFTLGQQGGTYVSRIRTTTTGNNGTPDGATGNVANTVGAHHVVMTRHAAGDWALYVDGVKEFSGSRGGTFANWNAAYRFAIANELTNNRAWLGDVYQVAVYDQAFNQPEVDQNYAAGPDCITFPSAKIAAEAQGAGPGVPEVSAYPNPFRSAFTLRFVSETPYQELELAIYDARGQVIREARLTPQDGRFLEQEFSLEDVTDGAYFVVLRSGDFVKRLRVMKQE